MFAWIKRQIIPVARFFGTLQAPWTVKKVTGDDHEKVKFLIQPGDVLLSRVLGHFSNYMIPGYWKHAAVAGPTGGVIEAVGAGVRHTSLIDFLLTKDEVVVLRPTFCTQEQAMQVAQKAGKLLGAEYDYEFSLGNKAFYCAELVYVAYRDAIEGMAFEARERLGVLTVTADDFYEARKWWRPVFDSRDNG